MVETEMETENGNWLCCVLKLVQNRSGNSGFKKWLVLFFLDGNYSKGKLYIFTTNYKVAATS
ncbi:hypothetical protein [Flavobacterium sp.]|uniref:hypothetical protein n=1 Tax=Flavobacterium sp. TaxID=239 RepID=UPI0025CFE995|nr:hypothetical protein [Flavobacterium sp.]